MRAAVCAIGVVACLALAGAALGSRSDAPPTPEALRPCSSRGDGTKPLALPSPAGEQIGPLVIWPTIRSRVTAPIREGAWPYVAKAPIVLPARTRVTLTVPPEARSLIAFQSERGWLSTIRFEACRERARVTRPYRGTVGKYTGFPFAFGFAQPSMCVPLEVWIDGQPSPIRRLIPVGRPACG